MTSVDFIRWKEQVEAELRSAREARDSERLAAEAMRKSHHDALGHVSSVIDEVRMDLIDHEKDIRKNRHDIVEAINKWTDTEKRLIRVIEGDLGAGGIIANQTKLSIAVEDLKTKEAEREGASKFRDLVLSIGVMVSAALGAFAAFFKSGG